MKLVYNVGNLPLGVFRCAYHKTGLIMTDEINFYLFDGKYTK